MSKTTKTPFGVSAFANAVAILVLLLAVGGGWIYRTRIEPIQRSRAIEERLRSLVDRRPTTVTRGQWGSAVAWTLNLHSNSLLSFEADARSLKKFQERLDVRLAGKVDMATIDWIWIEYASLSPHGASYQRFREMMEEEIEQVGPDTDAWGMNVP